MLNEKKAKKDGSNRTFMELKYAKEIKAALEKFVLIVPLWN